MNFKYLIFIIIFIVIFSCSIEENPMNFHSKPYIYALLKESDTMCKIIIDTSVSISSDIDINSVFIHNAEVYINNIKAYLDTIDNDSLNYKYIYKIPMNIEADSEYNLSVVIEDSVYISNCIVPSSINIKYLSDSSVFSLDSMSIIMWNATNTKLYYLMIFQITENETDRVFDILIEEDTVFSLYPFSFLFQDSSLYDIYVLSVDSNYYRNILFDNYSSFDNAYGFFGAISIDKKHSIMFLK